MATLAELQAQYASLEGEDSLGARLRMKQLQPIIAALQAQAAQAATVPAPTVPKSPLQDWQTLYTAKQEAEYQRQSGNRMSERAAEENYNRLGGDAAFNSASQTLQQYPQLWNNRYQGMESPGMSPDLLAALGFTGIVGAGLAAGAAAEGAGAASGGTAAAGGLTATGTTAAMTPEAYAAGTAAGYGTTGTAASVGLGTEGLLSSPAATSMPLEPVPMYNAPIAEAAPIAATAATSMPLEPVPMYNAPIAEAAPIAATNIGQYAAPTTGTVAAGGMLASSALTPAATQAVAPTAGGLLSNAANTVMPAATNWWESPQAWSTGLNMLGGYLQGEQATQAAQTSAAAQIEAARIAAEAAKFKPVGVTSRFGQSQFGYDDKGNLTSAGYTLSPEAKAQQDILMGISGNMLNQYQGAQAATAPMGAAGQQAMALGQGYLGTSPQAQAAQYMAEQQALLAPSREREMAALQNRLYAQGRGGLAIGGTSSGMMAANPELEAYYNAIRQQDLGLAAQATQGGMDYAKFGAGMVGAGGDLLSGMYGTQAAAYNPYKTALGGATTLEGLGQNPMDLGINIGAKGTAASAMSGQLLGQGMANAATTMQPANAYSPWVGLLSGGANMISQYNQPQTNQWGK